MKAALWACALTMLATPAAPADPGTSQPLYVVAYVDVRDGAAPRAAAALRRYRDASRGEPGASSVDSYSQTGRAGGFALAEVWRDADAFETHRKAAAMEQLNRDLQPLRLAPVDVRVHTLYFAGPAPAEGKNALTLLVHVDVFPQFLKDYERILQGYLEGSRGEPGLYGMEVLQTFPPHANHLTVMERWTGAHALEAHQQAATARTYREQLAPMLGALYDERSYRKMD